jgi:hypothetical protein
MTIMYGVYLVGFFMVLLVFVVLITPHDHQ